MRKSNAPPTPTTSPPASPTRTRIRYDDGSIREYADTPPPFPHTLTEPDHPDHPDHIKARLRAGEFILTAEDAKRLLDTRFTFTADPSPEAIAALPCGHADPTLCTDYCFPEPPNPTAPF